jgi:membrane-associated phospholipid phosphatase
MALTTARDGMVGFWDGSADTHNPLASFPDDSDRLDRLDPQRRIDILTAELMSYFRVKGVAAKKISGSTSFTPGSAILEFCGEEVFATEGPGLDVLKAQMIWLRNYADLRVDRIPEINQQLGDVPSFFGAVVRLDAASRKYSLEFVAAALRVTYALEMQVKFLTWTPRPVDLSHKVQPMIQTPDHSSFPSGHATESFAVATLLTLLEKLPLTGKENSTESDSDAIKRQLANRSMPYRVAQRVAANRTIAGVHYPIDSEAGATLGCVIASAILAVLTGAEKTLQANYTVPAVQDAGDFILTDFDTTNWGEVGINNCNAGAVLQAYKARLEKEWQR